MMSRSRSSTTSFAVVEEVQVEKVVKLASSTLQTLQTVDEINSWERIQLDNQQTESEKTRTGLAYLQRG